MDPIILVDKAMSRAKNAPESPKTAATGSIAVANVWSTIVNITGAGWLLVIGGYRSSAPNVLQWRITVDDDTPQVFTVSIDNLFGGTTYLNGTTPESLYAYMPFPCGVRFKANLLVEIQQTASGTHSGFVTYSV